MAGVIILALLIDILLVFRLDEVLSHPIAHTEAFLNITYTNSQGETLMASGHGRYGTSGPHETSQGLLKYVENQDWCTLFKLKPIRGTWVALIPRGGCSFRRKISNAKKQNASAVIVYNQPNRNDDFIMVTDGREDMVAVSVSYKLGSTLAQLRKSGSNITVEIFVKARVKGSGFSFSRLTTVGFPLASALIVLSAFALIHKHKLKRKKEKECEDKLSKLVTKVFSEEEEEDTCVICLDNYYRGQTLRVLQCKHRFHKRCVDPWILQHETCPICKRNVAGTTTAAAAPETENSSSSSQRWGSENMGYERDQYAVLSV